jgi:hypothetical protein
MSDPDVKPGTEENPAVAPARRMDMDPLTGMLGCGLGDEVVSSDRQAIGTIIIADPGFLTVEQGLARKSRLYVPTGAVATCSEKKVYLRLSKDQVEGAGWDAPPSMPTDASYPPEPQAER